MEQAQTSFLLLFYLAAFYGLPFAAGTLLLRFSGRFTGMRLSWAQALILSGVAAQGFLVPLFAGFIGAVFLAALLVQWCRLKFLRAALPLTLVIWTVNFLLLSGARHLFFRH